MLTCRELARLTARDELEDAGWAKRLDVRLHLFMCRHCRAYAAQLRAIGGAARSLGRSRLEDEAALNRLERAILKGEPRD